MSDALYLSLWYPNLRLAGLADKLVAVLSEFAKHGGEPLVYSATVWPVSWRESPVFQQVYGRRVGPSQSKDQIGAEPREAVAEALDLLHDDYAYEFQIGWDLWELETGPGWGSGGNADPLRQAQGRLSTPLRSAQDDRGLGIVLSHPGDQNKDVASHPTDEDLSMGTPRMGHPTASARDEGPQTGLVGLDPRWVRGPRLVRVTGFGPLFDEGAYEQEGHIRIDFGNDAPFLEEEAELDSVAARHIEENVRQLVELTAAVEKASGATARLLWSELGESLAQRLAERLGQRN
jgi:hypothetical protein